MGKLELCSIQLFAGDCSAAVFSVVRRYLVMILDDWLDRKIIKASMYRRSYCAHLTNAEVAASWDDNTCGKLCDGEEVIFIGIRVTSRSGMASRS